MDARTTGSPTPTVEDPNAGVRKLPIAAYIVIVVVYLVIVQGLSWLLHRGVEHSYASPTDMNQLWRLTVPVAVSLVFVYGVVAALRWWRPVFVDRRPVRRWVWVAPGILLVAIVAGINYSGLSQKGAGFVALLLLTTLFVGFAEEGMFRGIGVTAFRVMGYSEGRVALWTCVLFGLAHSTNLWTEGPKALVQVLVTAIAGYFFYVSRRVSGGLLVAAVLHGLWDFGAISGSVVAGEMYLGTFAFIFGDIVLAIVLLVRRRKIELQPRLHELERVT